MPCLIRTLTLDMDEVPDKERQPEFYMETTRTTRIVSILVFLVLLGQGDIYGYKYKAPQEERDTPTTINIHGQHTWNNRSHNIQTNIRQDKTPDIDFRDKHGQSPTVSPDTVRRDESVISDLVGHGFEEEDYLVIDYESDLQTTMSTTVRQATPNIVLV